MLKALGYAWSFPVTFVGIVYALVMCMMGWYRWHGVEGDALVWVVDTARSPTWLMKAWDRWSGHTIGQVVVMKYAPSEKPIVLRHEQQHVMQCMRLGVFQPIMYALIWMSIKAGCPASDAYYDCSFEVDARRAAGQVIDVQGTLKKLQEHVS